METIKLSDKFSIHKTNIFVEGKILQRAYQVISLKKTHPTDKEHFFYTPFRCYEFDTLNYKVLELCSTLSGVKPLEWAIQNWVYLMNNTKNAEIYHTHIDLIEGDPRIKTDWTFCYYLQIPNNITNDEGKISFKTEDNVEHMFLPKVGDLYIFPADLEHTPKVVINPDVDRVVFAGNVSLNPLAAIENKKMI